MVVYGVVIEFVISSMPRKIKNPALRPGFDVFEKQGLSSHRLLEVSVDFVEESGGGEPGLVGSDEEREVLGHVAAFDGVDADGFERRCELCEFRIVVQLGAVGEATGPGEDRGDRVGRGFLTFWC